MMYFYKIGNIVLASATQAKHVYFDGKEIDRIEFPDEAEVWAVEPGDKYATPGHKCYYNEKGEKL